MPRSPIAFADYLAELPDPRVDRTNRHRLDDIRTLRRLQPAQMVKVDGCLRHALGL